MTTLSNEHSLITTDCATKFRFWLAPNDVYDGYEFRIWIDTNNQKLIDKLNDLPDIRKQSLDRGVWYKNEHQHKGGMRYHSETALGTQLIVGAIQALQEERNLGSGKSWDGPSGSR